MEKDKIPSIRFKGFTEAWEQRKVKDLGNVITGNTPSTQNDNYYSEDGIPWVTPTDISTNTINDTNKKLSNEGIKVARILPKESILVTCIASIGKNTMLENTGSCNQQINAIVPDTKKYDPYFLLTESTLWSNEMLKSASEGTMQIVNKTEFSEIRTCTPELEEQRKVGIYFKEIDNLITLHQSKYNNKQVKDKINKRGDNTTWEQRKFCEIIDLGSGKDYKHLSKGNIPVFGTGGYMLSVNKALSYSRDGIGIGRKGTIDKPYILKAPFWTVDTLFYALCKNFNNLYFVYALFQKVNWREKDESTGVPSLSKNTINNTTTYIAKENEQIKIGNLLLSIDNLITLHQHK